MKRRNFVMGLGGVFAAPVAAEVEQTYEWKAYGAVSDPHTGKIHIGEIEAGTYERFPGLDTGEAHQKKLRAMDEVEAVQQRKIDVLAKLNGW